MRKVISIDLMGGDSGITETFPAAVKFAETNPDWKVIGYVLEGSNLPAKKPSNFIIKTAGSIIKSDAGPLEAVRNKDNTLTKSVLETVEGDAYATISAGSSTALTTASFMFSRPINDTIKPAFAPLFSSINEDTRVLLDVGANIDVGSETLLTFAKMATVFYKALKTDNTYEPKVALLNIGTEETKGDTLRLDTYKALSDSEINFVGNVEADSIMTDDIDIVLTDAFAGNILLKAIEGTLKGVGQQIKKTTKTPLGALGLFLAKKPLKKNLKGVSQQGNLGGAVVLGINHLVLKVHGSSKSHNFETALDFAKGLIEKQMIENLKETMK